MQGCLPPHYTQSDECGRRVRECVVRMDSETLDFELYRGTRAQRGYQCFCCFVIHGVFSTLSFYTLPIIVIMIPDQSTCITMHFRSFLWKVNAYAHIDIEMLLDRDGRMRSGISG